MSKLTKLERLEKAVVDASNAAFVAYTAYAFDDDAADDAAYAWVNAEQELREYLKEQQDNG